MNMLNNLEMLERLAKGTRAPTLLVIRGVSELYKAQSGHNVQLCSQLLCPSDTVSEQLWRESSFVVENQTVWIENFGIGAS